MFNKKFKKYICISIGIVGASFVGLKALTKYKKGSHIYQNSLEEQNPFEGKKVIFVNDENVKENADGVCGYLEEIGDSDFVPSFYDKYVKRAMDVVLSFGGLVVLSPVFAGVALAIMIEDPGPVFFTQKRVGQNKKYFTLHKFRSMKLSTPHDVPTHQLENPEQYITKIGKFIRAHSLDELPQIWDIFVGNMSVIGPRPALWNQDLLIAERDKYNANDVKPGLTGWAQINGRDELEIEEKARLDGEYVQKESLLFDTKCFIGTISKVGRDDSVVEGGTGNKKNLLLYRANQGEEVKESIPEKRKKILIIGENSYIGNELSKYLLNWKEYYEIKKISARGMAPQKDIFEGYDVILDVAGIAHRKETKSNRHEYYEINRDLTIEMAKCAKEAGVSQFIVMSTMSVYGKVTGNIQKETVPTPTNAYGDSKLQADSALMEMQNDKFKVVVLRPPMVYGKGCKGNYQSLRKLALKTPIFPDFINKRSMIYIGNLCEFIKRIIDGDYRGIYLPQNSEYVSTYDMVRYISKYNNKKIVGVGFINPFIRIFPHKILKKIFGNLIYEKVDTIDKFSFEESMRLTEKRE